MSKVRVTISTTFSITHTYTPEEAKKVYGTVDIAKIKAKEEEWFDCRQVMECANLHSNDSVKVEVIE